MASTLPELLRLRAAQQPDRTPIIAFGERTLTFAEWDRRSDRAARALRRLGAQKGARVALVFGHRDWTDYAIAYLGVLKTGAAAVHLGDALDPGELQRRLRLCEVIGVVHGASTAPPETEAKIWTAQPDKLNGGRKSELAPDVELHPHDIADILFTSGTTGPAKAFTNPHGTLFHGRGPEGLQRLDLGSCILAPMPMGTPSSAMSAGLMALTSPSTVVLCRPDDTEAIGELIEKHRVSTVLITPWIAQNIVAQQLASRFDLSSVSTMAVASAPLPARIAVELTKLIPGLTINTAYAQSEAVPAVVLGTYDPARPTALGRPGPGSEMRVADADGNTVPDGRIGEIWLRSGAPKRLYLDAELNSKVHVDGWTRTRDLGFVGKDGDLYLFDRASDVMHPRGHAVSSIEVEGVLYEHPAVLEAAAFAVPGKHRGEWVAAAIAVRPGHDVSDLADLVARRLLPNRRPQRVEIVAALPRGVTGKVLKHRLRAQFAHK